jgi:hypothetical protein
MNHVQTELLSVIEIFKDHLPADQLADMDELTKVGEPGIAFENLCTQLYEFYVSIKPEHLEKLRAIGLSMGISSKYWERLKDCG